MAAYVTVSEADDYFETHLAHSFWDSLSADEKLRALTTATRRIDAQWLVGERYDEGQDLAFPRTMDGDEVPERVKDACCEEALFLLEGRAEAVERGVQSVRAGDASETYSAEALRSASRHGLSSTAKRLLFLWLKKSVPMR